MGDECDFRTAVGAGLPPAADLDVPADSVAGVFVSTAIVPRFGATLAARIVGGCAGLGTSVLLARSLGANVFGDFNFLIATFTALNTFLDSGSSNAFFTFQSQDPQSKRNVHLFGVSLAVRFLIVAGLLAFIIPSSLLGRIWLGQSRGLIVLAFAGFFFSSPLNNFLVQIAEAGRRTIFIQSAQAALAMIHLALVAILYAAKQLSLAAVFALLVCEYALFALCLGRSRAADYCPRGDAEPAWDQLMRQYLRYCSPLLFYCALSYFSDFADRWLLQYFGGSAQQGFFSLSHQFASIVLLATASLMNIFWKEIAEAQHQGDRERVRRLYRRSSRLLFFLAAAGAGFLMPHSRLLLLWAAGPAYQAAWPALTLMLLYPVFQTLGQLNGVFFYATEDTRTHVWLVSAGMLLGLPLTYLLLAPESARVPGLGLGSIGLAARVSLWQMAVVSIQSWLVARRQGAPSDVSHHFVTLLLLLGWGWSAKGLAALMVGSATLWAPLLSALAYWPAVAAVVIQFPGAAGLEPGYLVSLTNRMRLAANRL